LLATRVGIDVAVGAVASMLLVLGTYMLVAGRG
jgi:hypothetical protein